MISYDHWIKVNSTPFASFNHCFRPPYNITTNTSGDNVASVPLKKMLLIAVKKINAQESCGPAITHSHFLNYLMDQQKQVYIYFS